MPDPLDRAFAAAQAICRQHARSFHFASYFLPRPRRRAAYAVYAFCRMIDDAIDAPAEPAHAQRPSGHTLAVLHDHDCGGSLEARLAMFRDKLDAIYAGSFRAANESCEELALEAFARTVHDYQIPKQYFLDLAEGCRMDLVINRYATWADLERYCYHVAGVVGLMMCAVFGLRNSAAREQAVQMGNAMQLTNILRDIKEDYERGRIYLPQEDLTRFGYTESDLAAGVVNAPFIELMKFEIARARSFYRSGAAGLCFLASDGGRFTASAMAVIYSGILSAIEKQRYDIFSSRAHLTKFQKFRRLPSAWKLARREDGEAVPDVFCGADSPVGPRDA